jgi:AraC-like DNA-binding protein
LSVPDLLRAWGWHFAPAAVQMAYYAIIFPMPLAFKDAWNDEIHVPYLVPLEQAATFISIAAYWLLSRRHYAAYQRWLADHVSDLEEHHNNWLRQFLIALAVTLVFWLGLVAFERWVTPLNYFQQFPLYVWWTVLSYYLGTEGYRHAGHRYPQWEADSEPNARADAPMDGGLPLVTASLPATPMPTAPPVPSAPSTPPSPNPPASATPRDWAGRMQIWKAEIVREEMWRDPELSLARLARRLGTNTGDLSRAINEGLGLNFNEFINRLRVDAVKTALSDPAAAPGRNLLDIAFEAGFSSKASFNRSFKLYAGVTPTAFRDRQRVSNRD